MDALNELPSALVVGWAIWLLGGLALMVWFRRRSAPTRPPSDAPARHRTASGVRRPVPRPPVAPPRPDAFSELETLLDEEATDRRVG
jgi:hypothetical protein